LSPDVSLIAARALGRSGQPAAAVPLANRLAEIDGDPSEFLLGKEIIAALARIPGQQSDEALQRLATKRSLMRRGRTAELQEFAKHAIQVRQGGGAA
jgi:HEAT repeat protein